MVLANEKRDEWSFTKGTNMKTKLEQVGQVANVDQSWPLHVGLNGYL